MERFFSIYDATKNQHTQKKFDFLEEHKELTSDELYKAFLKFQLGEIQIVKQELSQLTFITQEVQDLPQAMLKIYDKQILFNQTIMQIGYKTSKTDQKMQQIYHEINELMTDFYHKINAIILLNNQ
ncbi:hypothetical protein [Faucicola boevrei]|uniref:hypothetical protein n=1 Tax=Faucicola boevrei TaxID=346665 RepID=UPI000372A460|nr:hypothetical protein [Moraxella boevrei]